MSSGIDIQYVKEAYQKMSNDELIHLLTNEASSLSAEALGVAKYEVMKRRLNPDILDGIYAQQKEILTKEEIDYYCNIIQQLPDPETGGISEKLNATIAVQVISAIFFTHYKKKLIIGNSSSLRKANNEALAVSIFLGWWGIPWGIIRTIQAIRINIKNKKTYRTEEPNDTLRNFALAKIGEIETYKNDKEKLSELISEYKN